MEKFGENIIDVVKKIRINYLNKSIIEQLIRSGTSIDANYFEANGSSSKKDFINKIYIAKKEAKETLHWLRMLSKTDDTLKEKLRVLYKEAQELSMIFSKIISNTRNK